MPQYRGELTRTQFAILLFDAANDEAAADYWTEHAFELLESSDLEIQNDDWDWDEAPYQVDGL